MILATIGQTLTDTRANRLRGLVRAESALKFREEFLLALDTLRKNPLRSALTILGIVIGITTVIAVSSVINGLNENVLGGIRELGPDTIIAYRFPWASLSRPPSEWFTRKELQAEWAEDMPKLPHVAAASPSMRIFQPQFGSGTADVRRGVNRAKNVILQGNTPSISKIFDIKVNHGREFNDTDLEHRAPVVLLGFNTVNTLFPQGQRSLERHPSGRGNPRSPPPQTPPPQQQARRFRSLHLRLFPRPLEQNQRFDHHPHVRHLRRRSARRRHWRHEYHAGQRHRARPRNRHSQSHRRQTQQYSRAVPHRSRHSQHHRRRHRRPARLGHLSHHPLRAQDARSALLLLGSRRAHSLRPHRRRLWRLPRLESRPPRSRRSPPLRITLECGSLAAAFLRASPSNILSPSPILPRIHSNRSSRPMTQDHATAGGRRFPPTRFSVIEAAQSPDRAERQRALENLCAAYWKPVYKYIRLRWNRPAPDAQDLTQGFFAELLERELLNRFDPTKSRLR